MRKFLASQVDEKKQREIVEKRIHDEQAHIWNRDKQMQEKHEKNINDKINKLNSDNKEFLVK